MRGSLLDDVTSHYLDSSDFNGYPLRLAARDQSAVMDEAGELVSTGVVSLAWDELFPNPHIKAFPAPPVEAQLIALHERPLEALVAYPEEQHLRGVVDYAKYVSEPFTLRMALGSPAMVPAFFDVALLEGYRNDPRYRYETDDATGRIELTEEFSEAEHVAEGDQVSLRRFGFASDGDGLRVVVAYHRDLWRLTPQHQSLWTAREVQGAFKVHPNFHAMMVGSWDRVHTIFEAFREELHQLREMCGVLGWPEAVRRDFLSDDKPANFGFLIRPTTKEMHDFTATLDKMMSDNLSKDFFKHLGLEMNTEERSKKGEIRTRDKGTIQLLDDLMTKWRLEDQVAVKDMLTAFREVRKVRNSQAHRLDDDTFDRSLFVQQRDLVVQAYRAVRYLRIVISQHPDLAEYDGAPRWLLTGEIAAI